MNKTIITVVGKDSIGIIAKICTYLSDARVNMLDISQTIVDGFFNMIMVVDMPSEVDFGKLNDELQLLGEELGVIIKMQREDIFNKMHRI
ncbi:MAG: ACT domain-containing protein [Lachnospiraceae bacterium]|nr:ACT domain-containing protein [Lachnospiraceae bacterium]